MNPTTLSTMEVLPENLAALKRNRPELAEQLQALPASNTFRTEPSKQGSPTLCVSLQDGQSRYLHSQYDPAQEASRLIDQCQLEEVSQFIVCGLGLGYHLIELIKRANPNSKFLVIESQLEVFKQALTCAHFENLLHNSNIKWLIGDHADGRWDILSDWQDSFTLNGFSTIRFPALVNLDPGFYQEQEKWLDSLLQETRVAHNTRRTLSQLLYSNCFRNFTKAIQISGVERLHNKLKNHPAIIVAAGPSLDKNIQLIRGAQGSCTIVAVATALKPLLEGGVEPDFVVAVDPKAVSLSAFEGLQVPKKTALLFNACIPGKIIDLFQGNSFVTDCDLQLWKMLTRESDPKGQLGASPSVAHAALNLSLHLGCDPIVLVGQDLSFSGERSHCSGAYQEQSLQQNIGKNQTTIRLNQLKRSGTASAVQASADIFGNEVVTNQAMDSFRLPFKEIERRGVQVINATEGGVPLPGMVYKTLKEVLTDLTIEKPDVPSDIKASQALQSHADSSWLTPRNRARLNGQVLKFKNVQNDIERWLSQLDSKKAQESVAGAQRILGDLVADQETVQLLQEFLYSEFLDWNRETYLVDLLSSQTDQLGRKLEREKKLFKAIVKGADWFIDNLETLMQENAKTDSIS